MLLFWQFIVSITGLAIATYTDLKERTIPNRLTYSLIAIGIAIHAARAFFEQNISILTTALIVTIAAYFAGYVLWKFGVWAGGDVKLMAGIAALNPFNLFAIGNFLQLNAPLFRPIDVPVFPLTLFIFSIFSMLPYGAMISAKKLFEKKELLKQTVSEMKSGFFAIASGSAFLAGLNALFFSLNISGIFILLLLPVFWVFGKNNFFKKTEFVLAVGLMAFALWQNAVDSMIAFFGVFGVLAVLFIFIKLYFLSKKLLKTVKKISELEEGEIPSQQIFLVNGNVEFGSFPEIKTIINYLKDNRLDELKQYLEPRGEVIVSPAKARGVTIGEIAKLRNLVNDGKLEDKIEIKSSVAFVPGILIAYIILNLIGDMLWHLV